MSAFPNFNAWHKVPKYADIPAQTPYFTVEGGSIQAYVGNGWSDGHPAGDRNPDLDYYTEEPILSPDEEKVEKCARAMYYSMLDSTEWEYEDEYTRASWMNLARKYVEK